MSLVKEKMREDAEAKTLLGEAWKHMTKVTGKKRDIKKEEDTDLFDSVVLNLYYYVH